MHKLRFAVLCLFANVYSYAQTTIYDHVQDDQQMAREADAGSNLLLTYSETSEPLEMTLSEGVYEASMYVYKESDNRINSLMTYLTSPWIPIHWDLSELLENKWVRISQEIILEEPVAHTNLRFHASNQVSAGGATGTVHLDDFSMIFSRELQTVLASDLVSHFSIFPNPTTGMIRLVTDKEGELVLLDLKGRELWTTFICASSQIDLSRFKNGLYFVQFTHSGNTETKRVILK